MRHSLIFYKMIINEDHLNIKENFYFGNIEKDLKNNNDQLEEIKNKIILPNYIQNLKNKNKIIFGMSDQITKIKFFLLSISEFFFLNLILKKNFKYLF